MAWRLEMPHITAARCRACKVLGGTVVETEDEARAYSQLLDRAVDVGDELVEEPCVPEWWLEKCRDLHGRPCPRVVLDARNGEAVELFATVAREETRPLAAALFEATCGELLAEERAGILRRVLTTLQDGEVQRLLEPQGDADAAALAAVLARRLHRAH